MNCKLPINKNYYQMIMSSRFTSADVKFLGSFKERDLYAYKVTGVPYLGVKTNNDTSVMECVMRVYEFEKLIKDKVFPLNFIYLEEAYYRVKECEYL